TEFRAGTLAGGPRNANQFRNSGANLLEHLVGNPPHPPEAAGMAIQRPKLIYHNGAFDLQPLRQRHLGWPWAAVGRDQANERSARLRVKEARREYERGAFARLLRTADGLRQADS